MHRKDSTPRRHPSITPEQEAGDRAWAAAAEQVRGPVDLSHDHRAEAAEADCCVECAHYDALYSRQEEAQQARQEADRVDALLDAYAKGRRPVRPISPRAGVDAARRLAVRKAG